MGPLRKVPSFLIFITMDILNPNIINKIAGKTFKDGQYEYRIYIKTGSLGEGDITSISLFIENTPDQVGMDLALYALEHVAEAYGPEELTQSEFMINKILIEDYPAIGEILSLLLEGRKTELGIQSFASLLNKVKINLNNNIDFAEANRIIAIRKKKFEKVVNYMSNAGLEIDGVKIKKIHTTIKGQAKRHNDTDLAPSIEINMVVAAEPTNKDNQKESLSAVVPFIKRTFNDISPIDIYSYDKLTVTVANVNAIL
jgi:hypothetical protein